MLYAALKQYHYMGREENGCAGLWAIGTMVIGCDITATAATMENYNDF